MGASHGHVFRRGAGNRPWIEFALWAFAILASVGPWAVTHHGIQGIGIVTTPRSGVATVGVGEPNVVRGEGVTVDVVPAHVNDAPIICN